MTREGPPDQALVRRVLKRDERAFHELYRRHAGPAYRLALRMTGGDEADADDIAQETWRRAVRGLRGFEGRSSFRTWLLGIATRCAFECLRRRRPHEPLLEELTGRAPEPCRAMDLAEAIARMPAGYRSVLVLHDVEGFTHDEIGALLGVATGTSKSQLSRARAWLRRALGPTYTQE